MSEHYFSEAPSGDFTPREIEVELAGAPRRVRTAGGVFSPDHLDDGTRVLLRTLESLEGVESIADAENVEDVEALDASSATGSAAEQGAVLDLGCGWGPIALSAALRHPSTPVWAVDINARARELTAENAARLGLGNVTVAAPADVPVGLRFAQIHSNPPIRIGKAALHELLRQWLPRLSENGSAYLVVAKHLGAESLLRWIAAEFGELEVSRIARDRGFHIIEARRT